MDRNSLLRTVFIAVILLGGYWFFFGRKSSESAQALPPENYVNAPSFQPDSVDVATGQQPAGPPAPEQTCTVDGPRFQAVLSSHGAGLTHFFLTDARYASTDSHDLSTTPDVERWRNLRTIFRDPSTQPSPDDQLKYDRFDWKTEQVDGATCRFTYEDQTARIVKTVSADERPFELKVETAITNLTDGPRKHQTSIEAFAYRTNKEVKGKLGRVSPFQTNLECARDNDVKRLNKGADEFKTGWFGEPLVDRYAAIANYYFAQALVPLEAAPGVNGEKPACELQDEQWYGPGQKPDDENAGDVYKARLTYPQRTLGPKETATYKQIAYFGPKERNVLQTAAGGWPRLQDLINLGTFSFVAKFLVSIITWIHAHMTFGNWGLAIIVLTLGLRIVLFPLTWKQIQSAVAMRRLKPEIDALNAKFKDDPQAKNLAMMELWRKHKVNPLGGCLPALVQMPIWFALYATLQTAVEFYHTRFLWFADLSAPDPFYILPIVLGAAMIVQQRIVPQQGMDPVQQKMMMWLMPGVFTVMMLFLPAALGVYMLTNSLLGITQQLVTEKLYPRSGPPGAAAPATAGAGITVKPAKKDDKATATAAALRKGKARV
ncbi:MAG TPA: membrane protein insertase YidC [Polyangiaceae bacterium]|nr:membrane protein insertase YidC [Polyangiaceae bacterium]